MKNLGEILQYKKLIENKRPKGHICHMRNTFAQRYNHIITLIKSFKKSHSPFLSMKWSFNCKILSPFQPGMLLCKVWLKLAQLFRRRRFLDSSMYFHYFVFITPWKKALHLKMRVAPLKHHIIHMFLILNQIIN